MDFIFVTGKLGQGKTLVSVSRIKDRLERGCKVATNCDIFLHKMFNHKTDKPRVIRIPDKPTVLDLDLIGSGYDQSAGYDESKNGLLVLDECGTWFNARNWQDKTRLEVNNWFLHARKLGWDVFLIVQDISIIDSQARDSLSAGVARCKRLDKMRIPIIGSLSKNLLGYEIRPPKIHVARVEDDCGLLLDRWVYKGADLYSSYNTMQKFQADYPHGVHSLLTPWHLYGRYQRPCKDRYMRLTKIYLKKYSKPVLLCFGFMLGGAYSLYSAHQYTPPAVPHAVPGAPAASGAHNAPVTPPAPKTVAESFFGWSYEGAISINGQLTFYLVDPQGVRIPSTDDIFNGLTLSEPSNCALKIKRGLEYTFLKCQPLDLPVDKPPLEPHQDALATNNKAP